MGALHEVNASYYTTCALLPPTVTRMTNWLVVGAGVKLNAPLIGQGDYFQAQVNYTQGALRYIFQTPSRTGAR